MLTIHRKMVGEVQTWASNCKSYTWTIPDQPGRKCVQTQEATSLYLDSKKGEVQQIQRHDP